MGLCGEDTEVGDDHLLHILTASPPRPTPPRFALPIIFRSNADDHTLVTHDVVVFVDDMWIVIDYALPKGDNVPSTQGLQSVLAEKFSSTLSQHSNFRVELIDHLQAEAVEDKIRLRFRALDPSRQASEDHQFLRQLLSELQELSTKSDLAIKVGGSADVLMQPIPSSVRQIQAPDGPLASSTPAPKKQDQEGGSGDGSNKLTATVVPIVIVAVVVIAALLLLQQRRMAQLRRRYLRLEGKAPLVPC